MDSFLHYNISRSLGEGKHGDTFLALDAGLQRPVVIKRLRRGIRIDSDREKFLHSMKLLSSLDDRRITLFYGLEEDSHRQYLIREYIEGYPLSHLARQPLPFRRVISYGLQIARVLALMHDRGIWHLNLTPNNVFSPEMSGVTVTDFCLHYFVDEPTRLVGHPDLIYMAPEQLRGEGADFEADCWALGMILLRLATGPVGASPVGASPVAESRSTVESCLDLIQSGTRLTEVESLKDISEDGRLLLKKMIATDPADRFASSAEMLASAKEVAAHKDDHTPSRTTAESPDSENADQVRAHRAHSDRARPDRARQYLLLAILMALMLILWLVVTTVGR